MFSVDDSKNEPLKQQVFVEINSCHANIQCVDSQSPNAQPYGDVKSTLNAYVDAVYCQPVESNLTSVALLIISSLRHRASTACIPSSSTSDGLFIDLCPATTCVE